jgi:hypothetical protein
VRVSSSFILGVAAVVVIVAGAIFRLWGFSALELWGDEALWGTRVSAGTDGWIRPVGYMAITRALLSIHNNEAVMRALSIVPAIAQLPLMWLLSRRILATPWVAEAVTWLLSINAITVSMAKEFKPYALESAYHTAFVLLALLALEKKQRVYLAAFLAFAAVGIFFAWSCVFAFPAAFALLLWGRWRDGRRREAWAVLLAGAFTILELLAVFLLRVSSNVRDTEYWGSRYDVFFTGDALLDRLVWMVEKTAEIATFPSRVALAFPALASPLAVVFAVLCAFGGLALMITRRWSLLALLLGPWALALAFNLAGQWPYGLFRTNTFLIFYTLVLVGIALDAAWRLASKGPPLLQGVLAGVAVALLALTFPWQPRGFATKPTTSSIKRALTQMMDHELMSPSNVDSADKVRLLLGGRACSVVRYYLYWHTRGRAQLRPWFDENVEVICSPDWQDRSTWREFLESAGGRPFWALSAKSGFDKVTKSVMASRCRVAFRAASPEHTFIALCEPQDGKPDAPLAGSPLRP